MHNDQFDDLKQFIDSRISQSEDKTAELIDIRITQSESKTAELIDARITQSEAKTEARISLLGDKTAEGFEQLRHEMQAGFAGVAETIEAINEHLDERLTKLER